ncbi:MAG: hypothetical protein ABI761_11040 [Saprospiraceae bacterium]
MTQYCIPLDAPTAWKAALNGIRHSFGQTWENCYVQYLTTGLNTYLYCFESDHGRVVCPITEREFGAYVDIVKPSGFSGFVGQGDSRQFLQCWNEFVREKGYVCGYLGLDPIFDCSNLFAQEEIYLYNTVHVLDLTLSHEQLFANLSRNRKRQLKQWDNILLNFVFERSALIEFCFENFIEFLRRKRAPSFYYLSKDSLAFLFNLDNVVLVGVRNAEKVVAATVFAYTPDVCEALFTVSLPEEDHHLVSMYWYGIQYMKSLKIPLLNVGGGESSLMDFKRRLGGKQFSLKCIKEVYDVDLYQQLCLQANVEPDDRTGYFPGYRKVIGN